ncbi:protoheme IX farnesyltransferase [Oryzomonas japonica]|uniref:Protoheme IX farnesyltransferase n=1 Tax=Oryzomonas japonica TaxID=2603858 RepID=A0A7J4ZSC0_9BACT|nr:protoheme IX farnesyltransferase [Oryzomonas japonica]KAB0665991.1 protoheme IX farnesyltransferase [Oryzomonas japonica]
MIAPLLRLFRPRLALLNGVAAVGGYLLHPAEVQPVSLGALLGGVALLAAGGSAINQVVERDLDRLMVRTNRRPLPQGDLTPRSATLIGVAAVTGGLLPLAAAGGLLPPLLGAAALVWYLAVYTPLKRRTSLALAAGAVCGAAPPLIGWCLAGGSPTDYRVMFLAGLLYLWQIPHFWLFQRRHAADYRAAGIPLLRPPVGETGLVWLWMAALTAAAMLLPAFGIIGQQAALWYVLFPLPLVVISLARSERFLFPYLNLFPLLVTVTLSLGRF